MNSLQHKGSNMNALKHSLIWFFLILLSVQFEFPAFGSNLKSRQSSLYPYQSVIELQDEFNTGTTVSGSVGNLGWSFDISTSGVVTIVNSETNRQGIIQLATGTTINSIPGLRWAGVNNLDTANNYSSLTITRLNTNDANTVVRIGVSTNPLTTPPTSGIYFEKLTGDTNWFCITRNGGVQTRTDSSTAVTTSFTKHFIRRNSASVVFLIDGVQVCSHTTNIPSVDATPTINIQTTAAASKTIDVDYAEYKIYVSR